jgi:HD-like signal output (HDOD) protein
MNMNQFWGRSVYCATTAKQLATECGELENERFFLSGLLHDIGHLLMYLAIPEEAQLAILRAKELNHPLYLVERNLLGFDYAKVGAIMMGKWNLPNSLRIPTRFHPEPGGVSHFALETSLIHLSSLLVGADLENGVFGEGAFAVDSAVWPITQLTEELCLSARQTAADQFDEISKNPFL